MQESRFKMGLPNCQICKKIYDMYYHIPRVLPKCGHTFCQKCIKQKLINKKGRFTFTCPQCQSDAVIRKNVADELPKNITIAQLVKDGKHKNIEQETQAQSQPQSLCSYHGKKLQMVCIDCGNMKVCSHCAIFGEHKGHNIANEAGATNQDMQQLREALSLVEDTVNKIVLPNSPNNLQIQAKSKLVTGLQNYVRQNFKNYISEITRKQTEILQQCENITLQQKAGEYMDTILTSFDILRLKSSGLGKGASRSQVEQLIESAIQLHSQIQKTKQSFNKSVQSFLQQAKRTIRQTIFFDVILLQRRVLKTILKGPESPQLRAKNKQKDKELLQTRRQEATKRSQIKQLIAPKNKQILLTDKNINKSRIINATNPVNSRIKTEKYNKNFQTEKNSEHIQGQNINKLDIPPLPSRKNYNSMIQNDQSTIMQPPPTGKIQKAASVRKVTQTMKSPPKNNRSRSKSPINIIDQPDLKFYKPTKQLNYELRPKFQSICDEIDRQQPEGTLQLIGLQICDQLIVYLCDYLRNKKLRFSMIKLVKNNITDQGFKVLLGYLTTDTFTKVLNVTSNHLTYKSLSMIVNFVAQNNILKTIYLSNNKISPIQLKKIQGSLENKFVQVVL